MAPGAHTSLVPSLIPPARLRPMISTSPFQGSVLVRFCTHTAFCWENSIIRLTWSTWIQIVGLLANCWNGDRLRELPNLRQRIEDDLGEIAKELRSVRPLVDRLSVRDPDEIELRAVALTLHRFYNGVESIFLLIARHFDGHVPTGLRWHRQLLD